MLALIALAPFSVHAHATPISYEPRSSMTLAEAPKEVSIVFSEHLEEGASIIRVTGPSGAEATAGDAYVDASDSRRLAVPLTSQGDGTYRVSWGVVSSDDGHFTKGAYAFAVGEGVLAADSATETEVIVIATRPEVLAMTLELFGNGLVLATILFFAFVLRPLVVDGVYQSHRPRIARGYRLLMWTALSCIVAGAVLQIALKTIDLSHLQARGFFEVLPVYLQTAVGSATAIRAAAALLVGAIFLLGVRALERSPRMTHFEWAMLLAMGVFEYFRASVSHATANPFFTEFSVAVNFVHLIEKDIWAGMLVILCLLSLSSQLRELLYASLGRAFLLLSINVALLASTGAYIVWLHLKTFENLVTTAWGSAAIALFVAAGIVVALRAYHAISYRYAASWFRSMLPLSLAVECAAAVLVIYFSSAVIITSPPHLTPQSSVFSEVSNGATIRLQSDALRDGQALLTLTGGTFAVEPTVTLIDGTASVLIDLEQRFAGGYAFPIALIPDTAAQLAVRAPQEGAYDASASFTVTRGDFVPAKDWERRRSLDAFALALFGIALLGVGFAWLLKRMLYAGALEAKAPSRFSTYSALPAFVLAVACIGALASGIAQSRLANPFKARCLADGNMWHLMQPMRAGVPLAQTSREGCMWGMGKYQYLFTDVREYEYYRSIPAPEVQLHTEPGAPAVGVPTTFTVTLHNEDGTPATLFVDMEKLLHMVVVSEDQTVFAHIHPDDDEPLTQEEIDTATFTLRYAFPKAGRYLIALDYAHGITLGSKQFVVEVTGVPQQLKVPAVYQTPGTFHGYTVSADIGLPIAGEVSTMRFEIKKDGMPVENLEPYLSAAMHIAAVKNDFSAFLHTHGEVHPPGVPYPPVIVRDGKIVHSMAAMNTPSRFGPAVDAHVIFPSAGRYTLWAQFMAEGRVVPASFTVDVR